MNDNIFSGFAYLMQGFHLILSRGLKRFIIVPIIVNFLLLISVMIGVALYIMHFAGAYLAYLPSWLTYFLGWLFWLLFMFLSWMIGTLIFTMLTNLIASPFYGVLSEKVEDKLKGGRNQSQGGFKEILTIWLHTFIRECKKILYFLPWIFVALLFLILPATWPLFPFVWFAIMCWIMAVQFCDYAADNGRVPLRTMLQVLKQYPMTALSFGASVSLALMVPGLNLIVPAAAVAGGTALWLKIGNR